MGEDGGGGGWWGVGEWVGLGLFLEQWKLTTEVDLYSHISHTPTRCSQHLTMHTHIHFYPFYSLLPKLF